jgi:hypothetical protein
MEGQQHTKLYPYRTQNKGKKLKAFNLEEFLGRVRLKFDRPGYFIFDTNIYLGIGTNDIVWVIRAKEDLETKLISLTRYNKDYLTSMLNLLRDKKESVIILDANIKGLNNNLSRFRDFISRSEARESNISRAIENFYEEYTEAYKNFISELYEMSKYNRNGVIVKNKYTKFLGKAKEIIYQAFPDRIDLEHDKEIMFTSVKTALIKPVTLLSKDVDMKDLTCLLQEGSKELNESLVRKKFEIDLERDYLRKNEIDGKIFRTFDIQLRIV